MIIGILIVVMAACAAAFVVARDETPELGGTVTAIDGPLTFRSQAATVALGDGTVLIWGGRSTTTDSGSVFDPATGTWQQLPAAPGPPRFSAAATWTGTEAIIWGGSPADAELFAPEATGIAWNPTTASWRELPAAPFGLMDARAVAFETGVLFTGGKRITSEIDPADLWFNLADETWTTVPAPVEVLNVTWDQDRLLGTGRESSLSSAGRLTSWSVLEFDEGLRGWRPIAPPLETPWLIVAPTAGGELTAVTADMEELTGLVLEGERWVEVAMMRSGAIATIEPSGYPPVTVWTGDQLILGGTGGLVGWAPGTRTFSALTDPVIRSFGTTAVWTGDEIVSLSAQSSEGWTWAPPPLGGP